MSTKFVLFRTAGTDEPEPILINPAHVRPAVAECSVFARSSRLEST